MPALRMVDLDRELPPPLDRDIPTTHDLASSGYRRDNRTNHTTEGSAWKAGEKRRRGRWRWCRSLPPSVRPTCQPGTSLVDSHTTSRPAHRSPSSTLPACSGLTAVPAARLRRALESWGLFLATNHGVEAALMDDMMEASREFFRQPLEEKQRYTNLIDGEHFQLEGYGNDRVRSEDQILDWCDRLYLKVEPEEDRNLALWPTHPKSFRDVLHEFTVKCSGVKDALLSAMAKLLELDGDYFNNQFGDNAEAYARFNYYPKCPRPKQVFGIKPHSDATVLTVVMVDNNVGGLQVLRDGIWYDVPPSPHTLLINLGDTMEIMSNGVLKSPVHRVVTSAEKERLSVALFYAVDPEKEIEPATKLIDEKRPAQYKKVKFKDYTAGFFEHFSQGTRAIDRVKI